MPVTAEHRGMAGRIDARMKQLDALGLLEVEILPEMADFMDDFHHLMMNSEMDALCDEFAGFYRFAKILETLAAGIASGKVKVPGGRTVSKENRIRRRCRRLFRFPAVAMPNRKTRAVFKRPYMLLWAMPTLLATALSDSPQSNFSLKTS